MARRPPPLDDEIILQRRQYDDFMAVQKEYMRAYTKNSENDSQRYPQMQAQIGEIASGQKELTGAVGRIETMVAMFGKILMGNGDPEKGMVTRVSLLEKTVLAMGGADAWRKNLLAIALTSVATSTATALIVKLVIR